VFRQEPIHAPTESILLHSLLVRSFVNRACTTALFEVH